jgi:hypothetical protein
MTYLSKNTEENTSSNYILIIDLMFVIWLVCKIAASVSWHYHVFKREDGLGLCKS